MARPRIVVADDHDKTRARIARLLASDFDVVATVADGQAAVEAAGALYPDLVKTNLCFDIGFGKQGSRGVYLAVQEAF